MNIVDLHLNPANDILVVDDTPTSLKLLTNILTDAGYRVRPARDGELALRSVQAKIPALILLDIRMPGISGLEVCRRLKAAPETSEVPVIFISALKETGDKVTGFEAGGVDYVAKPFSSEEVLARVCVHLKLRSTEMELKAAKDSLEERVKERTAELVRANELLQTEILARKRMEEALIKAKETAEQADRAKSEFLANISHEFRTPLTSIMGFPVILKDFIGKASGVSQGDVEKALHCNEVISSQGEKLFQLVRDLLDVIQLESEHLVLEENPVSVHSLIYAVANILQVKAKEKGINLVCNISKQEDFFIMGDIKRLEQILTHLADNAVKFSQKGIVQLNAFHEGEKIIFQVCDEGMGMAEEETEVIFDRFAQLDGSSTRKAGGVGLGLNLVKRLVEKMDGVVSVESKRKSGTTMTVELPWKRAEMEDTPTDTHLEERQEVPLKNKKILVVDDDKHTRFLIASILKDNEFVMMEDGARAMEVLDGKQDFDVIILDRLMPVMDGEQFLKELVSRHPGIDIPILMLSAAALYKDQMTTESLGQGLGLRIKYVTKPFTLQDIVTPLKELGVAC